MILNQVTLPATDVDRSVAFYRRLGFKLIVHTTPRYARFECGEAGPECEDLDTRVEALKSKGIVFDAGPVDQRWLWREAYLSDPDGNTICLYHAGENRLHPPWRIK